jgi:hypothetical protein
MTDHGRSGRTALLTQLANVIDDLSYPEIVELASLLDAMTRRLGHHSAFGCDDPQARSPLHQGKESPMTTYVISLTDGRTAEVNGDEIRVVGGGALMIGRAVDPPPAPIKIVGVFASRTWILAYPADSPATYREPVWEPPPASGPRLLPAIDPDALSRKPW